jgi:serine protease Do
VQKTGRVLKGNVMMKRYYHKKLTRVIFAVVTIIIAGCVAKPVISGTIPSFNPIVKKLAPAVVNVKTEFKIKNNLNNNNRFRGPGFDIPDYFKKYFRDFPGKPFPRIPKDFRKKGVGSGVIISGDGYILTNNHVIENATSIMVKMNDRRKFRAKVIGKDPRSDIALIKIDSKKRLPYAELGDSSKLNIGDWVIAIGNPFGLEHTVTAGIVSAKGRKDVNPGGRQGYYNFIQTDASINPGNSGGPLIGMNGKVVGINTAIIASGQGIGFAIPINLAKSLIPQLKARGKVTRSWIGIRIQRVTDELAKSFGLKRARGALVSEVMKDGPGAKAGIKTGDIIIRFDGRDINDSSDLPLITSMAGVGKEVEIVVLRNRKRKTFKVKLGELPDDADRAGRKDAKEQGTPVLGIKVRKVERSEMEGYGVSSGEGGVIVEDVDPDSMAYEAGLRKGHLIMKLNGKKISGPRGFEMMLKGIKKGETVRMFIKIRDGSIFIAFTVR